MKKCSRCLIDKDLSEFSPQKRGLLGKQSRCKKCLCEISSLKYKENPEKFKLIAKKYREKNPEKVKENNKKARLERPEIIKECYKRWRKKNPDYDKKYYWNNENHRIRKKEIHKLWLKNNYEKIIVANKIQQLKFPEKHKARSLLRKAVYEKRISKPKICDLCMIESNRIEGHHEDYSRPLDVKWLCVKCHRNLHKELNL